MQEGELFVVVREQVGSARGFTDAICACGLVVNKNRSEHACISSASLRPPQIQAKGVE
jgi:hypothetical protein